MSEPPNKWFNPPTIIGGVMCASLCVHSYSHSAILTYLRAVQGDNHLEFEPAREDAKWFTIAVLLGGSEASLVDIMGLYISLY